MTPTVAAISRSQRFALLEDWEIVPFSNLFGALGEEVDDIDDAVSAIGQLPDGKWLVVDLTQFEPVSVQ